MSTMEQRRAYEQATQSAINLRDAVYAIQGLVEDAWHGRATPDRRRNAIDWIAKTMRVECDSLDEAIDKLQPKGGAA